MCCCRFCKMLSSFVVVGQKCWQSKMCKLMLLHLLRPCPAHKLCIFHPCSSRRGGKIWSKYQFLSISDYLVLYLLKTLWSGAGAGRKEQFKCCTMHNALCTLRKPHLKRVTSKTRIFSLKFFLFFSFWIKGALCLRSDFFDSRLHCFIIINI